MFDEIRKTLNVINKSSNVYISENLTYVLEPSFDEENKRYYKYLKFSIIRRGGMNNNVIFRASCKENNPDCYLKVIVDILNDIKEKYLKEGFL